MDVMDLMASHPLGNRLMIIKARVSLVLMVRVDVSTAGSRINQGIQVSTGRRRMQEEKAG